MIEALLRIAAAEARQNDGPVAADTMMRLAAEGYELDALEDDLAELNDTEN